MILPLWLTLSLFFLASRKLRWNHVFEASKSTTCSRSLWLCFPEELPDSLPVGRKLETVLMRLKSNYCGALTSSWIKSFHRALQSPVAKNDYQMHPKSDRVDATPVVVVQNQHKEANSRLFKSESGPRIPWESH